MKLKPLELLIIQPTPFCNIDCTYCYLPNRADTRRISDHTIDAIGRFVNGAELLTNDRLSVVWHAGEPLVLGPEFYASAFRRLALTCPATVLQHSFQTNGLLISDSWCQLFLGWQVEIGISIDGPENLHDRSRVDRSGHGTFGRVMTGIRKLQEHKIPFGVITVLKEESMTDPDMLWQFYLDLGATSVAFNLEESEGVHTNNRLSSPSYARAFGDFIGRIDKLANSQKRVRVRELAQFDKCLEAPPGSRVRKTDNSPGAIITIDVEGNISTFSPELSGIAMAQYEDFRWGNVNADSWASVERHPAYRRAAAEISDGVHACLQSCEYFPVCGGGAPSNKLSELGTFSGTETAYCRVRVKTLTNTLLPLREAALTRQIRKE